MTNQKRVRKKLQNVIIEELMVRDKKRARDLMRASLWAQDACVASFYYFFSSCSSMGGPI